MDPTFYPVVYGLKDDEDWEDEANWYKINPSLGYTVDIERLRDAYREAKQNPADEITFKYWRYYCSGTYISTEIFGWEVHSGAVFLGAGRNHSTESEGEFGSL